MSDVAKTDNVAMPFRYWPDNIQWSHQFWRGPGKAFSGGGDFAECHLMASKLEVGDIEGWYKGWFSIASQVEQLGDEAAVGGHEISARDCYLRACNYYRSAEYFVKPWDSRKLETYGKSRGCFHKAIPFLKPVVEPVEIPYEGTAMYGYFCHPMNPKPGPYKTLIYFGGIDSTGEELFLAAGRAAVERGYACLIVDGPGQGATLRWRKIPSRYDYEAPVKAAVDYLWNRTDVDRDRIALMAYSLGGYYAPRAAAFEKRLKACVVWGAVFDVPDLFKRGIGSTDQGTDQVPDQVKWVLGVKDASELAAVVEKWTLKGVVDKITCPFLIVHGEDDTVVPVDQAYLTYEAAKCDKTLKVFKRGEPGTLHCQYDSYITAHYYIFNWLEDKVK